MLGKMVYLARFRENTQVIKVRQIIRATKDRREKTCTSDTEGGIDSELEVSAGEMDEEEDRVPPPKGEKKKRVKSTSRSTARSRESEDDSLDSFTSFKYREKISKLESRLFQAYRAYTANKAQHPPTNISLVEMYTSELKNLESILNSLENTHSFKHTDGTKNVKEFFEKEKISLCLTKANLLERKEIREEEKKEQASKKGNLEKEFSLRKLENAINYPGWKDELTDLLKISSDKHYLNNVTKKVKSTIKDPALYSAVYNLNDLSSILSLIKDKFDNVPEKTKAAILAIRKYKIPIYTSRKPPDIATQIAAATEGTVIIELFKDNLTNMSDQLLLVLKKEVLFGYNQRELNTAVSKLKIQIKTFDKKIDFSDVKDINSAFDDISSPALASPVDILNTSHLATENENKESEIKLLYLQFKSAIKNLQQQEANITAEASSTSVNFYDSNCCDVESEVIYSDPEFIFFHNVETHNNTTDVKQKAEELAQLYEAIWRINPKNNDSMLENCILQCNKKAHPRGSLRFCAILLSKPLEEMKNLMNMGKTRSCKTCFTPMASRYGHETNRCPLRMLKCPFCNGRHPGVVCNTIPTEKKMKSTLDMSKARQ